MDNNSGENNQGSTENPAEPNAGGDNILGEWSQKAGVGQKYQSMEDLAKGKVHADAHIENQNQKIEDLTGLVKELLETSKANASANEVLDQLNQSKQDEGKPAQGLTETDIQKYVNDAIANSSQEAQRTANLAEVNTTLKNTFGENATEKFKAKCEELGLSPEFVTDAGAKSPQALYQLMGITSEKSPNPQPNVPSGNVPASITEPNKQLSPLDQIKQNAVASGLKRNSKAYFEYLETNLNLTKG